MSTNLDRCGFCGSRILCNECLSTCAGCGTKGTSLCSSCEYEMMFEDEWNWLAELDKQGKICPDCKSRKDWKPLEQSRVDPSRWYCPSPNCEFSKILD